jgi:hypothetical protein
MGTRFDHGYALLIGVGRTAYEPLSLPVTVKDVEAIRKILADPAHCAYYPDTPEHIRLIHDEGATRSAILDGLVWLKARAESDPEATVLVLLCGAWLPGDGDRPLLSDPTRCGLLEHRRLGGAGPGLHPGH